MDKASPVSSLQAIWQWSSSVVKLHLKEQGVDLECTGHCILLFSSRFAACFVLKQPFQFSYVSPDQGKNSWRKSGRSKIQTMRLQYSVNAGWLCQTYVDEDKRENLSKERLMSFPEAKINEFMAKTALQQPWLDWPHVEFVSKDLAEHWLKVFMDMCSAATLHDAEVYEGTGHCSQALYATRCRHWTLCLPMGLWRSFLHSLTVETGFWG